MFAILLRYYRVRIGAYFSTSRGAKIVTSLIFLAAVAFMAFEVYLLFRFGFRFMARDPFLRDALFLYVTELFLLVSFILVFASALASGAGALWRSEGDDLIMASPRYGLKPYLALSRMALSSLWPLFVIMVPALLAIADAYEMSALGVLISLGSALVLVCFGALLALLVLLLAGGGLRLMSYGHHTSFVSRRSVTVAAIAIFLLLLGGVWDRFRDVDLVALFQSRMLTVEVADLGPIVSQFEAFPSHIPALAIFAAANDDTDAATYEFGTLLAFVVIAAMIFMIAARLHLPLWQLAQEGRPRTRAHGKPQASASLAHADGPLSALFAKEAVAFVRDARGMLWFGFILLIWLFAVGANRILVAGLAEERVALGDSAGIVAGIVFASSVYFVAMAALRFVFPAFSMERKKGWLLGSAPIDQGIVFVVKLAFFAFVLSVLALGFGTLEMALFALPPSAEVMFDAAIVIAVLFVTVLALSLGAIFPNRDTDDPELLSTTAPGLAFIGIALAYGGVVAFALARYVGKGDPVVIALALIGSIAGVVYLLARARRALSRMEFA